MTAQQVKKIVAQNRNVPQTPPQPVQNCSADLSKEDRPRIVAFFIGGAGDKEVFYGQGPNRNVLYALNYFQPRMNNLISCDQYESYHLGYYEVHGMVRIFENVIPNIRSKKDHIYIVGHSLGGWNGAHLSQALTSLGYSVEMLVTLDPVGEGLVKLVSRIYGDAPMPKAKYWINIRAEASVYDESDWVATAGNRWDVSSEPEKGSIRSYVEAFNPFAIYPKINKTVDIHHLYADRMFTAPLVNGKSAADLMEDSIMRVTK